MNILRKTKYLFSNEKPSQIETKIGHVFNDPSLLKRALTHRSAAASQSESYERLEFLGDAVLDTVVSEYLIKKYPTLSEGELTQMRSMLVNAKTLHEIAISLQLQEVLRVDKSINLNYSPTQRNLFSCALEAIIGAIYLDAGLEKVARFIHRFIIASKEPEAIPSEYNYKGQLLELCQKKGLNPPDFRMIKVQGPDHARQYTVAVYINNRLYGSGTGTTKRTAEQQAAEKTYKMLVNPA